MKLAIPEQALASHAAYLGKAGSGKSSSACTVVSWLLDRDRRVCIIDPTGVWWGLRLKKDGKRRGYNVVIFGGRHADLPLTEHQGAAIAEIVGTSSTPVIIDTSLMTVGARTRFFSDFGEALLRKNSGPLHLVIDEAHLFAPQGRVNDPQSGKMLHATNNLISLGRARGLRVTMITQRPAKLHKDSLTQAETLIAMRLIAPQDRDAVKAWIEEWAEEGQLDLRQLPSMKTGVGIVWSPQLNFLDTVQFPRIETFDSFATPEEGDDKTLQLPAIDMDVVSDKLKQAAQIAKDNDPQTLKIQIADLRRDLDAARSTGGASKDELANEYQRGFAEADGISYKNGADAEFRCWDNHLTGMCNQMGAALGALERMLEERRDGKMLHALPVGARASVGTNGRVHHESAAEIVRRLARKAPMVVEPKAAIHRRVQGDTNSALGKGERTCMTAIVQLHGGRGITREHLTVVTGYKKTSRNTYLQRLSAGGFIQFNGETIQSTQAGRDALGDVPRLPTGTALRQHYVDTLPQGEAKILRVVIGNYPDSCARPNLAAGCGYSKTSTNTYIQRLGARGLIVTDDGGVRAHANLFD